MLKSVTLQNFKSFGKAQTVPLSPITVLVGANNSGKSSFLGFAKFVKEALANLNKTMEDEGGIDFVFHRPALLDGLTEPQLKIEWQSTHGSYESSLTTASRELVQVRERLEIIGGARPWVTGPAPGTLFFPAGPGGGGSTYQLAIPFIGLRGLLTGPASDVKLTGDSKKVVMPVLKARYIRLELPALKTDARVVPKPAMATSGLGMAAELALWKGSEPGKAAELDDFLKSCLPELEGVLVKPAPEAGFQRVWIRQRDGQDFDAPHCSDGVLCFIGLAMHAVSAGEGSLMLIEEPEQSIHPRRLHQYVELLRSMVAKRRCQFVIATHSPVLLNEFRDEPEAILLFNRGSEGTEVRRLSDDPTLMESLARIDPGDPGGEGATPGLMLQDGFFNSPDA